jgi:hypothetical protein
MDKPVAPPPPEALQPIVRLAHLEELVRELAVTVANLEKERQSAAAIAETQESVRETLHKLAKEQAVTFERIVQIQADLDVIRSAWAALKTTGT